MSTLADWLETANLQKYHRRFVAHGVDESNFTALQFADYDAVGIRDQTERQRLFKLIQTVKREADAGGGAGAGAARGGAKGTPSSRRDRAEREPSSSSSSSSSSTPSSARKGDRSPSRGRRSGVGGGGAGGGGGGGGSGGAAGGGGSGKKRAAAGAASSGPPAEPALDFEESRIRVVVRKRPLSRKEDERGEKDIIHVPGSSPSCFVMEPKQKVDLTKYIEKHQFVFDATFDETGSTRAIYQRCCRPLVDFLFEGGRATCFAYGQTGSGKTFTMMGPGGGGGRQDGLYVLAAEDVFRLLPRHPSMELHVSFFEIYGGKLYDLLNERKKLVCREDGSQNVVLVGIKDVRCQTVAELLSVMSDGNKIRSTGRTGANADSSRSHAILQMNLVEFERRGKDKRVHGKFSFIDLAGSERGADTASSSRQARLEGAQINQSLLALKECIRAMDQQKSHKPFRGSKLTQVLKDSFIGNSRTMMIANISPNAGAVEHTLNTLRYADRVKELRDSSSRSAAADQAYMPHQGRGTSSRVEDQSMSDVEEDLLEEDAARSAASRRRPGGAAAPSPGPGRGAPGRGGKPRLATPASARPAGRRSAGGQHSRGPSTEPRQLKPRRTPVQNADSPRMRGLEEQQQEDLMRTHEAICSAILEEEDAIVEAHRRHIDSSMTLVKQEMQLLKSFDQLDMSVDEYVEQLDSVLASKIKTISDLRAQIATFKEHLREEELLSSSLKGGALNLIPDSFE